MRASLTWTSDITDIDLLKVSKPGFARCCTSLVSSPVRRQHVANGYSLPPLESTVKNGCRSSSPAAVDVPVRRVHVRDGHPWRNDAARCMTVPDVMPGRHRGQTPEAPATPRWQYGPVSSRSDHSERSCWCMMLCSHGMQHYTAGCSLPGVGFHHTPLPGLI